MPNFTLTAASRQVETIAHNGMVMLNADSTLDGGALKVSFLKDGQEHAFEGAEFADADLPVSRRFFPPRGATVRVLVEGGTAPNVIGFVGE